MLWLLGPLPLNDSEASFRDEQVGPVQLSNGQQATEYSIGTAYSLFVFSAQ